MSDVKSPSSSFADIFEASGGATPRRRTYRVGEEVHGTVVQVGSEGIFVDLGEQQQAFFSKLELADVRGSKDLAVGDPIRGYVTKIEGGNIELGRRLSGGMSGEELETALREKTPVEGKVTGVVKGGVTVDIGGTRAFCPMGMLDVRFVKDASIFLTQTLRFQIVEVRGDRDVIVSRRVIVEAEQNAQRDALLSTLQLGARMHGTVTRTRDFGAFVDLGGIEGLIPTRELTHDRRRPEQVVSEGDYVEVRVLDFDTTGERPKITLSLKALASDPWDAVAELVPVGKVIEGKVVKLMDFGAFVQLAPGIEGLLHASELGGGARHPATVLSAGEPIAVVAQSIDTERRRISLVPAPKGAVTGESVGGSALGVGAIVEGTVEAIESFGVFVQIEGTAGRAGRALLRARESLVPEGGDLRRAFPMGSKVRAKLISAGGKLELSLKAMKDDEERQVFERYAKDSKGQKMGTLGDLLKSKVR